MKHLHIPLKKGSQTNKKHFLSTSSSSSSSSSSIFPVTPITKVRLISHDGPGRVKMIELPKNEASNGKIWPPGLIYIDHFFQGFGRWKESKNEPIWVAAVSYPTTPPRVPVVSRSRDQFAVVFLKPSFHLLTPITPEELTSTQRFFPKDVSSQGSSEDCWRISHHTYPTHIQHITHIPHISIPNVSHQYASHQYSFNTYPASTYPFNAYPFKRFASVLHTYPFKTYPTNTYPTNTFSFNTYPTNTYPCDAYPFNAYPFKRCASAGIANVSHQYISHQYKSVQHVSHQYGSIQCVSIQKVCISRNGNEYEYHCLSFHTIATRREWQWK